MPTRLKPPEVSELDTLQEQDNLRSGTRTPRPYHHDAVQIWQGRGKQDGGTPNGKGEDSIGTEHARHTERNGHLSVAGSESGTEADDERPNFVRALPAPHLRPRKGLKTGEANEDALLTPSQLDDEGRRLSQDYFGPRKPDITLSAQEDKDEQQKLSRRRLAEFARRTSEVGLMMLIIICVMCGKGVLGRAYEWRRELLSHVAIITTLILVYPVKLSIVDTSSHARKLWQRFRVPASFDPATVLYPPLLPVLVVLSVSPANAAVVLPNIILGLSSLPQRLFPRSSRLGGINVLHWFISILPLIASETTAWPSKESSAKPYLFKCPSNRLAPEMLVVLYPLHHALLQALSYLTTTSLLITELHLLSAALINLLLLAASPQTNMLKACLWVGGVPLFVTCWRVLQWNVTLMRVPRWKLRRPGQTAEERKSLVDAVSDLVNLQRAVSAFGSSALADSDADEDEPKASINHNANRRPKLSISHNLPVHDTKAPNSAIEPRAFENGALSEHGAPHKRPRSNTMPPREAPTLSFRQSSISRSRTRKTLNLAWYLDLTPAQAKRRKWLYAAYLYIAMAVTVLLPVRYYVLENALYSREPIGWAVGYLLGQIQLLRDVFTSLGLEDWVSLPAKIGTLQNTPLTIPLDIPALRLILGPANVRLILIAYWALVLLAGLLAVFSLTAFVEVDTRRKVFHGVMVAMMLPSTFIDPCACALALSLMLAVFLLLEIIRAGQVLPLGNAIGRFVAPYVDGRDLRGPVVVSHIFLLIGCAVPFWFSLASINRTGDSPWVGWELEDDKREVAMSAGVVCVGMGDAAASLFGRRYGRHKWLWVGGKSLEGSAAFVVAVTLGLVICKAWLVMGGWNDSTGSLCGHLGTLGAMRFVRAWIATLAKAILCACGASFMEAVLTGANDNVVVPVALWLLVKGVRL